MNDIRSIDLLSLAAIIAAGASIGRHFGIFDGITAALVVYALMPYKSGR